jgi:hypothetical protein
MKNLSNNIEPRFRKEVGLFLLGVWERKSLELKERCGGRKNNFR